MKRTAKTVTMQSSHSTATLLLHFTASATVYYIYARSASDPNIPANPRQWFALTPDQWRENDSIADDRDKIERAIAEFVLGIGPRDSRIPARLDALHPDESQARAVRATRRLDVHYRKDLANSAECGSTSSRHTEDSREVSCPKCLRKMNNYREVPANG